MNHKYGLAILAIAASATLADAEPKLKAVASFSILGDMVHIVGGDSVAVKSIVGPDGDSHVYEPTPDDAKTVAGADVLFLNGLGLETWLPKLADAANFKGRVVTASQGIKPRHMDEDGKTVLDPHAWQDLSNGLIYVQNIADGLCAADQNDCPGFRANAERYSAEIKSLNKDVHARFAAFPEARRKVVTTHDAFGYFGDAYGVRFMAPEGFSTESEPTAKAIAGLITQIKTQRITALFFENMSDPRVINQIASETGVAAGAPLYADALSKPGQGAESYLAMFRHNVSLLLAAMSGS